MSLVDATNLSPLMQRNSAHLLIVSYSVEGRRLPDLLRGQPISTTYTEMVRDAHQVIRMGRPSLLVLYFDGEAVGPLQVIRSAIEYGAKVIVIGPGGPDNKLASQC